VPLLDFLVLFRLSPLSYQREFLDGDDGPELKFKKKTEPNAAKPAGRITSRVRSLLRLNRTKPDDVPKSPTTATPPRKGSIPTSEHSTVPLTQAKTMVRSKSTGEDLEDDSETDSESTVFLPPPPSSSAVVTI